MKPLNHFRARVQQLDDERMNRGVETYPEPFQKAWEAHGGKLTRDNVLDLLRELGRQHDLAAEERERARATCLCPCWPPPNAFWQRWHCRACGRWWVNRSGVWE